MTGGYGSYLHMGVVGCVFGGVWVWRWCVVVVGLVIMVMGVWCVVGGVCVCVWMCEWVPLAYPILNFFFVEV